jgi:hypothetical protein
LIKCALYLSTTVMKVVRGHLSISETTATLAANDH